MGSFVSRIFTPTYKKILILGYSHTGKSSILHILNNHTSNKNNEGKWLNFFSLNSRKIQNLKEEENKNRESEECSKSNTFFTTSSSNEVLDKKPFVTDLPSTLSFNHSKINIQEKNFTLWDLSYNIRQYWKCYYHQLDGLIIVLDSIELKSNGFKKTKELIDSIVHELKEIIELNDEKKIIAPVLFLLNKIDKSQYTKKGEIPEILDLNGNFDSFRILECTIFEKTNILKGFGWLINEIHK